MMMLAEWGSVLLNTGTKQESISSYLYTWDCESIDYDILIDEIISWNG